MKIAINEFKKDPLDLVYKHKATGEFNYSDGENLEDRIISILKNSKDNSLHSSELKNKINDWVTEYHFSSLRHNLLRHINFRASDKILELGCGCGAISRQLAESGAQVTAIEGSPLRAKAAAARCSDLDNVKILCSNFQDLDLTEKYDLVTLVGVLEYSPLYFKSFNPILECLNVAINALKSDGVLVVAIENQLGLKYICGYSEDHVSKSYFGVEGRYSANTPITFGMKELREFILTAGCSNVTFNFPFPDYKIPRVVFTDKAFNTPNFSPCEIIRQIPNRDYSNKEYKPTIDDQLAAQVFCRNGLMPELSNSFLVFASKGDSRLSQLYNNNLLATLYSCDRHDSFNTRTNFILENDQIKVSKSLLNQRSQHQTDTPSIVTHRLETSNYINGLNLEAEMSRLIKNDNLVEFSSLLSLLINFIEEHGLQLRDPSNRVKSIIKPDFIDCLPSNIIIKSNQLYYIDREWSLTVDVKLEILILRILDSISLISQGRAELQQDALIKVLATAGFFIDEQAKIEHINTITAIHNLVYQGLYKRDVN